MFEPAVNDHADTIRRYLQGHTTNRFPELLDAMAALDALLAEQQQLQEERDLYKRQLDAVNEHLPWEDEPGGIGVTGRTQAILNLQAERAERQQAIDALRDTHGWLKSRPSSSATALRAEKMLAAALAKLGEKP